MICYFKKWLLFLMLIGWAFSTQAALEVTLESFKITAGETDSYRNLSGEYRLSIAKKGDKWQTHCFDHWIEFYPNNKSEGWVGYQAKELSGCQQPKVVYGQSFRLGKEFDLNRDFYQKYRTHFYQYSCQIDPPGLGNSSWHKVLSNEINMLDYTKCESPSNPQPGNPTPYIDANNTRGSQTVLYSPIKVTEQEVLQLCFFEMDFWIEKGEWSYLNQAALQYKHFRIHPFFPSKPTKIKPIYTYATHDYYEQFNTKEWSKKNWVKSCFELSAETLRQRANNNPVVLHLTSGTGDNKEKADITLTIKPVLSKPVTSLIEAFSKQLSKPETQKQFLAEQNNWAVSYNPDHPSDTDKARSKTLDFPFTKATDIILHSHLLNGNQWVLPQGQLIGFIKDWILTQDSDAYLVFKQNQKIQGIRSLAMSEGAVKNGYRTFLSGYDVQIQWQQQNERFSATTFDSLTQAWILNKDKKATIWLSKNNQLQAAFALTDLRPDMSLQQPKGINNPKIYFSKLPPNGIENPWSIQKTPFFQATLNWLTNHDNKAFLTLEDRKQNTLIYIPATSFNQPDISSEDRKLTVSIPNGLDWESLTNLATVKISRGQFSRQYPLSETIELPRGDYQLSDFKIDVAYKKPWVTHLLADTKNGDVITLDYQTKLPKLTITAPNNQLSDAEWKQHCHLEQHPDANTLFKAIYDGQAEIDCYPLLIKDGDATVEFKEMDQTIHFNLQGIKYIEVKIKLNRTDLGDWYLTDGNKHLLFTEVFNNNTYTRLMDLMTQYDKSAEQVLQTTWQLTKEEVAQRYKLTFSLKDNQLEHSFDTVTPEQFFKTAQLPSNSVWSELRFEVTKEGKPVGKNCQINSETQFLCDNNKSLMLTDFIGATLKIQGLPDSELTFSSNEQDAKIPLTAIRCGQWSKIIPLSENSLFFRKQPANCDSIKLDLRTLKISKKARELSNNLCTFTFNRNNKIPSAYLEKQATKQDYKILTAADPDLNNSQDAFCNDAAIPDHALNPVDTINNRVAESPTERAKITNDDGDDRCYQPSDKKWLHLMFLNSDGNWRKYYLAAPQKRKQFIESLQARFPDDVGLYIWFLSQPNREEQTELLLFKQALKKTTDFPDYEQAYQYLIKLPRRQGDSRPIDNQIARSLELLKLQIETSDKLDDCDKHTVILFTNGLNANTASSQLKPHLPDLHQLVVLAGEEADQSQLTKISLGKVTFIPLKVDGQWRDTLVQKIESLW